MTCASLPPSGNNAIPIKARESESITIYISGRPNREYLSTNTIVPCQLDAYYNFFTEVLINKFHI